MDVTNSIESNLKDLNEAICSPETELKVAKKLQKKLSNTKQSKSG